MKESYVTFSNFKGGLDTRRSELTSQPGVLLQLQDAHVNEGAEIENRWAFTNASYVPENSQGLEVVGPSYNNTVGLNFTGNGGVVTFGTGSLVTSTLTRARAAGIATLTISAAKPIYTFVAGDPVVVYNMGNAAYNGTFILLSVTYHTGSPNYYTVTYAITDQTTELTTADLNGVFTWGYLSFDSTVSRAKTGGIATIVVSTFPVIFNVANGNSVLVQGVGGVNYNGVFVVKSITKVGSNYQITYDINDLTTEATTADVGGTVYYSGYFTNNVYYQPLVHPAVQDGATFDATYHAMTSVTASTSFGGFPWVSATYSDGLTFAFWNGSYVPAFRNGQVLNGWTSKQNVATQVRNYINSVLSPSGYAVDSANLATGFFSVAAPYGQQISFVESVTSAAGTLTVTQTSAGFAPVIGVAASATFTFTAATTGNVTDVRTSLDAYASNLLTASISYVNSLPDLANRVALNINQNPNAKFTAISTGATITLADKTGAGISDNGLHTKVICSGDVCTDNIVFNFQGTWAGGDSVTSVKYNTTGVTLVEILGVTINYATSLLATVQAIAAQIIANNNGYTAIAVAASSPANSVNLWISRLSQQSDNFTLAAPTNGCVVTYTSASGTLANGLSGGSGAGSSPISVVLNPTYVNLTSGIAGQVNNIQFSIAATATGGSGTLSYVWSVSSAYLTILSGQTSSSVSIQTNYQKQTYIGDMVTVVVSDAFGNTKSASCYVSLV